MEKIDKNKENCITDVLGCNENVLTITQEEKADSSRSVCYTEAVAAIRNSMKRRRELFVMIGYYLKKIKENKLYLEGGYENFSDFTIAEFGMCIGNAIRLVNVCKYFSKGNNSPYLDERYEGVSASQLFELLHMRQRQRYMVTPDMTVRQFRQTGHGMTGKTEKSLPEKDLDR